MTRVGIDSFERLFAVLSSRSFWALGIGPSRNDIDGISTLNPSLYPHTYGFYRQSLELLPIVCMYIEFLLGSAW